MEKRRDEPVSPKEIKFRAKTGTAIVQRQSGRDDVAIEYRRLPLC